MEEPIYSVQLIQEIDERYFMILLKKHNFNLSTTIHFVDKALCESEQHALQIGFREVYNVEIDPSSLI